MKELRPSTKRMVAQQLQKNHSIKIWHRVVAGMASVVVFCTTYALILPAITAGIRDLGLDSSFTCGLEEHTHTEACYTDASLTVCGLEEGEAHTHTEACYTAALICEQQEGEEHTHTEACYVPQLICGQQEGQPHIHTEACYEPMQVLSCALAEHTHAETCLPAQQPEQPAEQQPEDEQPEQQPEAEPVGGHAWVKEIEASRKPMRLMAASPFALMSLADEPAGLPVEGYIPAEDGVLVEWQRRPATGGPVESAWQPVKPGDEIHANDFFRFTVKYEDVNPEDLKANGYKLYLRPESLVGISAGGSILVAGTARGTVSCADGVVTLEFDHDWVDEMVTGNNSLSSNKRVISGDFNYAGGLDLSNEGSDGSFVMNLGDVVISIPTDGDAISRYADLDVEKTGANELISIPDASGTLHHYVEYTVRVTASRYGSPAASVLDVLAAPAQYLVGQPYVGVTGTRTPAQQAGSTADGPVEAYIEGQKDPDYHVGNVFLTTADAPDKNVNGYYTPAAGGTHMVWELGDMGPNEVRTLTYRVEVSDAFYGVPHTADNALKNTASAYSKASPHGIRPTTYVPTATADLTKNGSNYHRGDAENGEDPNLWYADFVVQVQAGINNSYPLTNVKVRDDLDRNENNGYRSDVNYLPGSIKVFTHGSLSEESRVPQDELAALHTGPRGGYNGEVNPYLATDGNAFEVYVGDLDPGESRWITYTMTLNATSAQIAANGNVGFYNQAETWSDDTKGNGTRMDSAQTSYMVSSQTWERKIIGAQTLEPHPVTFAPADAVVDATRPVQDGLLQPISPRPSGYTIPAAVYGYTVVINEQGEWDVTSAAWADTLGQNTDADGVKRHYLMYDGYVQVAVYDRVSGTTGYTTNPDGTEVAGRPKKTVWVKVDGQTSFNFTGKQLGLDGDDAYILTYYARPATVKTDENDTDPTHVPSFGTANVDNSFGISGSVGYGGFWYNVNMSTTVTTDVKEPGVNDPEKFAWYYDAGYAFDDTKGGKSKNGALYWYIEITGQKIPNGSQFQESVRVSNNGGGSGSANGSIIRNAESHIGFYAVNLHGFPVLDEDGQPVLEENGQPMTRTLRFEEAFPTMADFEAALKAGERVREVPRDAYTTGWSNGMNDNGGYGPNNYDMTIEFTADYVMTSTENLYWLVRTDPISMPPNGGSKSYYNKVNYKYPTTKLVGGNWPSKYNSQTLIGPNGSMEKDPGAVFVVENTGARMGEGDIFKYNSTAAAAKFKSYVDNGRFYTINENGMVPVSGVLTGGDARRDQLLQNSLLMVCDSVEELLAIYNSPNAGNYSPAGMADELLNYQYADGVYITFNVTVNRSGKMNNQPYELVDVLPDGLELAYVRTLNKNIDGKNYPTGNYGYNPGSVSNMACDKKRATGTNDAYLADGWQYHVSLAPMMDSAKNNGWTDYYTKDNQLKLYLPQVKANQAASFQIVCRVTDGRISFEDVDFENTATLYDEHGRVVEADSATITARTSSVDKKMLIDVSDGSLHTTKLPYSITINPTALDMDPESNTVSVPLIDHMSPNLAISMDTLRIYQNAAPDNSDSTKPEDTTGLLYSSNFVGLYQALDAEGRKLYWQGTPTQGTGLEQTTTASTTTAANWFPVYGYDLPGAEPVAEGSRYSAVTVPHVEYEYGFGQPIPYGELDTGRYLIRINRNQQYLTTTAGKRGGKDVLLSNPDVTVATLWTITKRSNTTFTVQAPDGSYLVTGDNMTRLVATETPASAGAVLEVRNGHNGDNAYYGMGTRSGSNHYCMNNLGSTNNIGGWSGFDAGSNLQLIPQIVTSATHYGYTGVYWNTSTPIGTTPTAYPVVTTRAAAGLNGVAKFVMITDDPASGHSTGNVPNALHEKDKSGNLLYLDAAGNKTTTITNTPCITTTTITVEVERYVDAQGNSDGSTVLKFHNLPDSTPLVICYDVTADFKAGSGTGNSFGNRAYWEGYEKNDNGNQQFDKVQYSTEANAFTTTWGAVMITKHAGEDETIRLAGAEFKLFRAGYVQHAEDKLVWGSVENGVYTPGTPESSAVANMRYAAVYIHDHEYGQKPDEHPHDEVKVCRDPKTGNLVGWYDEDEAKWKTTFPSNTHHAFDYDANGNLQVYEGDMLAYGRTDANGLLSYGFGEDFGYLMNADGSPREKGLENRVHFNKVYAIVETKAPEGYDLDPTPHFFVIPTEQYKVQQGDYFYHPEWPESVHVCTRYYGDEPTYFLDVYDYKGTVHISKGFGGNAPLYKPGNYEFGLYRQEDILFAEGDATRIVGVKPSAKPIQTRFISYTEEDFGWYVPNSAADRYVLYRPAEGALWRSRAYTRGEDGSWAAGEWQTYLPTAEHPDPTTLPGAVYGILPGHQAVAVFTGLTFNETVYAFELNDSGSPVLNGAQSTVNGEGYIPAYIQGKLPIPNALTPTKDEAGQPIVPEMQVSNNMYAVRLQKRIEGPGGLPSRVVGTYYFGIQRKYKDSDQWTPILQVLPITWGPTDVVSEKEAAFTGLLVGETYRVMEVVIPENVDYRTDPARAVPINSKNAVEMNENVFTVSYQENQFTVTGETVHTATVVNQAMINLPLTGGTGIRFYVLCGLLLMAGSLLYGVFRHSKKGRRSASS